MARGPPGVTCNGRKPNKMEAVFFETDKHSTWNGNISMMADRKVLGVYFIQKNDSNIEAILQSDSEWVKHVCRNKKIKWTFTTYQNQGLQEQNKIGQLRKFLDKKLLQ